MKEEEEIEKLYESLATDMKNIKGQNVDNLKGKLEAIRKNKTQLEDKIKQYERKLGKWNISHLFIFNLFTLWN